VNRNHLAGFLEMSLAIGIGPLIAGLDRSADMEEVREATIEGSSARRWFVAGAVRARDRTHDHPFAHGQRRILLEPHRCGCDRHRAVLVCDAQYGAVACEPRQSIWSSWKLFGVEKLTTFQDPGTESLEVE
jgi:hypothetical protein